MWCFPASEKSVYGGCCGCFAQECGCIPGVREEGTGTFVDHHIDVLFFIVRDEHILELHVRANMKLVDIRRQKQILTCFWRNIQKGIVKTAQPIRQNRSAMAPTIYLPIPRTTLFKKSVFYMGATSWNALPRNVRSCDDTDKFKLEINNIFV